MKYLVSLGAITTILTPVVISSACTTGQQGNKLTDNNKLQILPCDKNEEPFFRTIENKAREIPFAFLSSLVRNQKTKTMFSFKDLNITFDDGIASLNPRLEVVEKLHKLSNQFLENRILNFNIVLDYQGKTIKKPLMFSNKKFNYYQIFKEIKNYYVSSYDLKKLQTNIEKVALNSYVSQNDLGIKLFKDEVSNLIWLRNPKLINSALGIWHFQVILQNNNFRKTKDVYLIANQKKWSKLAKDFASIESERTTDLTIKNLNDAFRIEDEKDIWSNYNKVFKYQKANFILDKDYLHYLKFDVNKKIYKYLKRATLRQDYQVNRGVVEVQLEFKIGHQKLLKNVTISSYDVIKLSPTLGRISSLIEQKLNGNSVQSMYSKDQIKLLQGNTSNFEQGLGLKWPKIFQKIKKYEASISWKLEKVRDPGGKDKINKWKLHINLTQKGSRLKVLNFYIYFK